MQFSQRAKRRRRNQERGRKFIQAFDFFLFYANCSTESRDQDFFGNFFFCLNACLYQKRRRKQMKMENAPRALLELQQHTKKISLLLSYKTQTLVMINWRANIRICISKKKMRENVCINCRRQHARQHLAHFKDRQRRKEK